MKWFPGRSRLRAMRRGERCSEQPAYFGSAKPFGRTFIGAGLLCALTIGGGAEAARVYKWVDSAGNVQFSDQKPGASDAPAGVTVETYSAEGNTMSSAVPEVGGTTGTRGDGGGSNSGSGGGGSSSLAETGFGGGGSSGGGGSAGGSTGSGGGGSTGGSTPTGGEGGAAPAGGEGGESGPTGRRVPSQPGGAGGGEAGAASRGGRRGSGVDTSGSDSSGGLAGSDSGSGSAGAGASSSAGGSSTSGDSSNSSGSGGDSGGGSGSNSLPAPVPPVAKPPPPEPLDPADFRSCSNVQPPGAHAHFEQQLSQPYALAAWALRSDAEIQDAAAFAPLNKAHRYDPTMDADKITFAEFYSLTSADQLKLRFPRSAGEGLDQKLSWQYEIRFSSGWLDGLGAFNVHKGIRLDDERKIGKTDLRFVELQFRYGATDSTAVALPTIRAYGAHTGFDGNQDPIRTETIPSVPGAGEFDLQPGGATKAPFSITYGASEHLQGQWKPFIVLPNRWIRVTETLDFSSGEGRLRVIMSDEQDDPVVVIDDPENPGAGFLVDRDPSRGDTLLVEFNSSQIQSVDSPRYIWVRNFVVAVDVELPHGGRPLPSTCAD